MGNGCQPCRSETREQPVWLSTVMRDYIQPVARSLGVEKKISWHTFRHTCSSILKSERRRCEGGAGVVAALNG
jgi:hypothetical protein